MSENENKELANTTPGAMAAAPDFMGDEKLGLGTATEYAMTAFSRIIQGASKQDAKDEFGERTLLLTPENVVVASGGTEFIAIPVIMFTTYEMRKHMDDTSDDGIGICIEKTMDKNSELAAKAMDFDRRYEDYPDGRLDREDRVMRYRFVEAINCIFVLDDCPENPSLNGSVMMHSWDKGEFVWGKRFYNAVERKNKAIFGSRYALSVDMHQDKKKQNSWWGIGSKNPTEEQGGPWVQGVEQYEMLKAMHINLVKMIEDNKFEFTREGSESNGGGQKTGSDAGGFDDGMPPV